MMQMHRERSVLYAQKIQVPSGNVWVTAVIELVVGAEGVYLKRKRKYVLASVVG